MQQLWATFRRKLEAMSNLQLKQIRLAYTLLLLLLKNNNNNNNIHLTCIINNIY